jgi:hypothetical protein
MSNDTGGIVSARKKGQVKGRGTHILLLNAPKHVRVSSYYYTFPWTATYKPDHTRINYLTKYQ